MLYELLRLRHRVWRAELILCLLILGVAAYWIGGEIGLIALTTGFPVAFGLSRRCWPIRAVATSDRVIDRLDAGLREAAQSGWQTGCLVVQFDDPMGLCDRHGRVRQSEALAASVGRLRGALRPGDLLFPLEDGSLAVVLAPTGRLDLEVIVNIAGRMQLVAQQPMVLNGDPVQLTCCIGFCHSSQQHNKDGKALLEAAQIAVDEACRNGPGAIRAFSADLAAARADRDALRREFASAVAAGQVRPHFQPQLSTDTGAVSGIEALARWYHPDRGCLAPGAFLSAIEGTDLMELLGETMLAQSLAALVTWDTAGHRVPSVSVNFSARELSDPQLPERIGWALDRHSLAPQRLTVEVLESVVAGDGDDIITRNIDRLARMGCGVDMDDFGTGHASITSIRRFALRRLKIDRSFVRAVDSDRAQQQLITAILSLSERLGLETLAEGVESQSEHAMLAQLGCGHVQGYVVARPMPTEEVEPWLTRHEETLARALRIGVRAR